jgi:endonuclease/exonuclease/phosphatase (EEP) superfamily protein YafD
MNRLEALIGIAVSIGIAIWAIGQWYRDTYWLTGILFYIPTPVVVAALLVGFALTAAFRYWRAAIVIGMLMIAPLWMLLFIENHFLFTPARATKSDLTLIHWNIKGGNPRNRKNNALSRLEAMKADIIVLSDAPWVSWHLKLTGMSTLQLGRMAVYTAGEVVLEKDLSDGPLKAYLLRWQSRFGDIRLLLGDLVSSLRVHRAPHLSQLVGYLNIYKPDILVGDLNSPRRSKALSALHAGYQHAYDIAGSGWSYTWPWPLPVYAIDNCVVGPTIIVSDYELRASRYSDHRMQRLEFSFAK